MHLVATTIHRHVPFRARLRSHDVHRATTTLMPSGEGRRRPGHHLPRLAEDTTTGRSACFRGMLQVLHMDVAKVDRDVARVCSKCFICFSDVCCKYFYLDVAYVFTQTLQAFV
jgi:hypothetical protein